MLSEYNEALHIATEKKISYEEGFEAGVKHVQQNIEQERQRADEAIQRADEAIRHAAKALIDMCREIGMNSTQTVLKLCADLNIDKAAANKLIDEYWTS